MDRSYCRAALAFLLVLVVRAAAAVPAVVPLTLPSGKVLQVEVMVSDEDRAMGLMFRPSLAARPRDAVPLRDRRSSTAIWMKNCKFPIDIVWLDEDEEGRPRGGDGAAVQGGPLSRLQAAAPGRLGRRAERGAGPPREGRWWGPRSASSCRAERLLASFWRFFPNSQATSTPST